MHFGGYVPVLFVQSGLLRLMSTPHTKAKEAEAWALEEHTMRDTPVRRQGDEEREGCRSNRDLEMENSDLKRALAEKDALHSKMLAEKEATIVELTQRVQRRGMEWREDENAVDLS